MAVLDTSASVHPTAYARDNVYGRAYVERRGEDIVVGFRAEPDHACAFELVASDIQVIREHVPTEMRHIGYVEIRTATITKTLFFQDSPYDPQRGGAWDGHRLVDALVPFTDVLASQQVQGMYLINPSAQDRAKHQTPRFADDAIEAVLARRSPLPPQKTRPDTFASWAKSTHMSVLTQLSHVMRGARDRRDAFFAHPLVRRATPQVSPSQAGPYMVSAQTPTIPAEDPLLEFDAARVYLAKWAQQVAQEGELNRIAEHAMDRGPDRDAESLLGTSYLPTLPDNADAHAPLSRQACIHMLDAGTKAHQIASKVFRNGLDSDARQLVWPYMLGALTLDASPEKRQEQDAWMQSAYNDWFRRWYGHTPTSAEHESSRHRIWIDCLRADIKHPFFATDPGPLFLDDSNWTRTCPQGAGHSHVQPHLYILSDILWTFDVYAEHAGDPALPHIEGYVQGMSDLCLVCYVACQGDKARTFWTFVALMRQWGRYYVADQSGMRHELLLLQRLVAVLCPRLYAYLQQIDGLNLFFCFRWLLVCFKREFALDDVMRIWDAIWSASWSDGEHRGWPLCTHMHLFVALAILESHERLLIRHLASFDEVLMFVNSLAFQMDAASVLRRAEALVYRLRTLVVQGDHVDSELRAMVLC